MPNPSEMINHNNNQINILQSIASMISITRKQSFDSNVLILLKDTISFRINVSSKNYVYKIETRVNSSLLVAIHEKKKKECLEIQRDLLKGNLQSEIITFKSKMYESRKQSRTLKTLFSKMSSCSDKSVSKNCVIIGAYLKNRCRNRSVKNNKKNKK